MPGVPVFNVAAYGAKADGVTDDTAAIQEVLYMAGSVQGAVEFPAGQPCLVSGAGLQLVSGIRLAGTGPGAGLKVAPGAGGSLAVFQGSGVNKVRISRLTFDGNRRVNFPNQYGEDNASVDQVGVQIVPSAGAGCSEVTIENCRFYDFLYEGIWIPVNSGAVGNTHTDHIIKGNRVIDCGYGITVENASRFLLSGNILRGNGYRFGGGNQGWNIGCIPASATTDAEAAILGNIIDGFNDEVGVACGRYGIDASGLNYSEVAHNVIGNLAAANSWGMIAQGVNGISLVQNKVFTAVTGLDVTGSSGQAIDNDLSVNVTTPLAGTQLSTMTLRGNLGVNPVGVVTPAVPASGTAVAAVAYDRTFYVTTAALGCTMTIQNGPAVLIPATSFGTVRVPAGKTVTPTYTNAPTWVVEGE